MYVFHLVFCNFTLLPPAVLRLPLKPALLSLKIKILNFIELELSQKEFCLEYFTPCKCL